MAAISPDVVHQVALLSRLRLEGPALTELSAQLNEIVGYVHQLQAVPTEGVEPTSHVLPLANVLRKDEPHACLSQADAIALAPASQPPFVKVPKVIDL